ncbi:phosphonate ABC transporter phosphonate-binding protein [Spiroplasma litorale]|uniref:Phosphonate ABC transporter phosphonate-binding protein n=1 Tax=Spiroplasma litorale TaxID=216942 RepID=A0A0K1W234_9MOLU|nr:PhnD/SsuA/transferrin family substrate-binding protein [Spiroplasma litorale]AKX34380.1 phosphonate ABC transporter phosphonate-binding protein [Spiroplasma litorale]
MKKLLLFLGSSTMILAPVANIVSCGDSNKFIINLTPVKDPIETEKAMKPLEGKLQSKMKEIDPNFNKSVSIKMTESYENSAESLKSGTSDLGFLPINAYESFRGDLVENGTHKDLGVLSFATKYANKGETNFEDFIDISTKKYSDIEAGKYEFGKEDKAIKLANHYNKYVKENVIDKNVQTSDDLTTALTDTENYTSHYRSYVYANTNFVKETLKNSDLNNLTHAYVKTLIDKAMEIGKDGKNGIALNKSVTSSSGTLYPLSWLQETLGYDDLAIKEIYTNKQTYDGSGGTAEGITSGKFNIAFNFEDVRSTKIEEGNHDVFEKSMIIGTTYAIPNDGLIYSRKNVDESMANNLRKAFSELVADKENDNIFGFYGAKSYTQPEKDQSTADFEKHNDSVADNNLLKISHIKELLKELN